MNNGRKMFNNFNKNFMNSKYSFKLFNTKINSFMTVSNVMNNVFHKQMFKLITTTSASNNTLAQLASNSTNSVCSTSNFGVQLSVSNIDEFIQMCRNMSNNNLLMMMRVFTGNEN